VVLVGVMVVGSIGYVVFFDLSPVDAIYMSLITATTVGFSEIGGPYGTAARVWTAAILILGMGAALYSAFSGLEYAIEALVGGQRAKRQMYNKIDRMSGHIILCGFGRVGRTVHRVLQREGAPVVVVDINHEKVENAALSGALAIEGNATHDDVLEAAGIDRASVVIPAVASDSDNLVITLSAKARNPELLVVARAIDEETESKLFHAGADRVVAPQLVGGERLATLALNPNLAEFIDLVVSGRTVEFRVEEITVGENSGIIDRSLRDIDLRNRAGALVLAIGDQADRLELNPSPAHVFSTGQLIIGVGTEEQLARLRAMAE
jgi:voltage-gated potassium channel